LQTSPLSRKRPYRPKAQTQAGDEAQMQEGRERHKKEKTIVKRLWGTQFDLDYSDIS
jgi:hypothetical protein